ncbi:uncharacterized protein KIAA0040 homolog [Polypterus senegalus]|uniref:uncharacterized protein KIAA0040 homolog n=1 Tax=Polypterus senegalus TaxID=55291 RepID=UPI0019665381|nr:uncharacterized protein KIAA0040 homolog [Polypterus senegalus]XP_039591409.1 uncharacterized protein KIAA0040 homolog [Polypterus senegalus]
MWENVTTFFNNLWNIASTKHEEGIYNTVCLVVLLALPLVVLFTSMVVCCHCCCCRKQHCCSCCGSGDPESHTKLDKKKKKNKKQKTEDLWISVKPGPMTPDRMALTAV